MSLKNGFGFLVSPENLTPAVLNCIIIIVVSVSILLVVTVTYKCKQKKNRSKNENRTAERNSSEALNSGETKNDNKHFKEEEAAALKLSDEHQTEEGDEKNLQTQENNSPSHDVDEEVAVAQQQLQGEEQHRGNDELDKTEVMTPDTVKEKQEASSQLNLGLAVTTRNKKPQAELKSNDEETEVLKTQMPINESPSKDIKADVLMLHDENEQNELLQIVEQLQKTEAELKRKDEEIEELKTQLEKLQWLRNDTLKGMDESQRKFTKLTLAIKRMEKLEENVGLHRIQSLCSKNESLEKDLQTLKTELEASQSEVKDLEAEIHKFHVEKDKWLQDKEELQTTQGKLEAKNKEVKDLEAEIHKFHVEKDKWLQDKEELQTTQGKLEAKNKEVKDLEAEIHKFHVEKDKWLQDKEELQTTQGKLEAKNKEVKDLEAEIHKFHVEKDKWLQDKEELQTTQGKLEAKNKEVKDLEAEIHKFRVEKDK
ncbi:myosin-9 isoform X4 [Oreochromis niloticus]|uniref:myosin-9 isoform X4 n=1 Tax=Oreochromis niloticus TaxID=8128 RepID=UPI0009053956|nr:myosin-9 isoform X4 [Oreochromis niloticus]